MGSGGRNREREEKRFKGQQKQARAVLNQDFTDIAELMKDSEFSLMGMDVSEVRDFFKERERGRDPNVVGADKKANKIVKAMNTAREELGNRIASANEIAARMRSQTTTRAMQTGFANMFRPRRME